jgi:acetylglutamate kinase
VQVIKSLRGKTVVVKYGGNAMINNELKASLAGDLVVMQKAGINVILVHGGGPEIEAMLKATGRQSRFVNGLRYTDEQTMEIVQMVLCGKVNKDIVALLQNSGANAIGLCGIDCALLQAERITGAAADLGLVGKIVKVNVDFLRSIMQLALPVISSVALCCGGESALVLNVNADTAAAEIAAACKADKLILMTDIAGILRDVNKPQTLIGEIGLEGLASLKAEGVISRGMIPKVECCEIAVRSGVGEAHIIDGRVAHSVLDSLSGENAGTIIKQIS